MKLEEIDWEKEFMPDYVDLYYVDYNDSLDESEELLQECVDKNALYPISENINEWWDFPEGAYLKEIRNKIASFFDENGDEDGLIEGKNADEYFEEHDDSYDFREWLWDHDKSTPVDDLLRNTGAQTFYYDLDMECDCGWHEAFLCQPWRNESCNSVRAKVARKLGIKKGTKEWDQLGVITEEAYCGGRLRIYFSADIKDMLTGEGWDGLDDKSKDYSSIRFQGTFCVAIYNPAEGAGHYDTIKLDKVFDFHRENLSLSACGDTYDLESAWGMCSDWCSKYDSPVLGYVKKTSKLKRSESLAAYKAQEAEYIRVFKAGGCTLGDTNYSRHRNVQYINEVPCGSKCPHCGQFWID